MGTTGIKSIETMFEIVGTIQSNGGATLTELATTLDLPTSTAHNYLKTLEQTEYIVCDDGTYHVGLRFLEHGAHARNRIKLYDVAVPEVDKLADQTGELANLLVEEHGRGVYLHRAYGEEAVQVEAHIGTRVNLHSTALGKAILAHLPAQERDAILDRHGLPSRTESTITNRDELLEVLETVRDRGYAYDRGERLDGLKCVAAPVVSSTDRVLGAVSVAGPANRFRTDRFENELPTKLLEVVNVIELNVTHS
ncbi:IclR family transcriptional regulator [Halocatena halophila]|uniref:IclR family transcriptional regulator n=1 Tax=Halocatena halophila TaxID=2814576 RepID=UPI002ED3982F